MMVTPHKTARLPLLLRQDCLHLDALPHWLASPWVVEQWDDVVLPLQFADRTVYVASSGLLVTLPQGEHDTLCYEGRTGEASSGFCIERRASHYDIKGTLADEVVNLSMDLAPGRFIVKGPAGRFRSDYRIERDGKVWVVQGATGEFFSNYQCFEEGGQIRLLGSRRGKALNARLWWENDTLHYRDGTDGVNEYSAQVDGEGALEVTGTWRGEPLQLSFKAQASELRMTGSTFRGKVSLAMVAEENRLVVKGRIQKWFVSYRIEPK